MNIPTKLKTFLDSLKSKNDITSSIQDINGVNNLINTENLLPSTKSIDSKTNVGSQLNSIIEILKSKNQMNNSFEKDLGCEYEALKFKTIIDENTYTVSSFREVMPNWKDSGTKGSYLNSLTVTDKNNNKLVELSTTCGKEPSFIISPKEPIVINIDELTNICNLKEILPKKETSVIHNIQSIREHSMPAVNSKISLGIDWK